MTENRWTQQMTMHLNGGSEFSQLNYALLLDGNDTGIVRVTRTDGSPRYNVTSDLLIDGEQEFDMTGKSGSDALEWLNTRMDFKRPAQSDPE